MDRIRLALIGAGGMANAVHYPSLAEFPDVEMAGLCDLVEERLNATADRFNIQARYRDYRKMIEDIKPDAAYILMPPHQLYDLAVYCLSKGIHLFIEKPPGITSYQTKRLSKHARSHGCLTMVGFNRRYIPLMTRVKEMAEQKGPILQAVASFYKNMVGAPPYYDGAVDLLTCDVIHAVDALRWMCGEASRIASHIRALNADYENSFNALIKFESGASGVLLSNWTGGARVHTFEMHSIRFSAFIDPNTKARIFDDSDQAIEIRAQDAAGSDSFHKVYGFSAENRHFIDCVRNGKEPMTSFEDAAKTMELIDRINASRI